MNKKFIALFSSVLMATALYATFIGPAYDRTKPPGMSLSDAYGRALIALGTDTNQFHCVSADISTAFFEGEWYFTFYSTNSKVRPKNIAVDSNGKASFDNGYR